MKFTSQKLATIAGTAIVGAGILGFMGAGSVLAETANSTVPTIVQNLATKFGVSTSEVQKVFDDTRTQERTARLDEAVTAGTITSAQKELILKKEDELKTKMDAINAEKLTETERQEKMKALRTEIETWATENKIPINLLHPGGMKGGRGPGMGMGR